MKHFWLLFLTFLCFSCFNKQKDINVLTPVRNYDVDDSMFIVNGDHAKGDVRRYGLVPNEEVSNRHLENILQLAKLGLPIYFPEGYYNMSIILKKASNITMDFDNVIIGGSLQILDEDGQGSKFIEIAGTLAILDKLFIRQSNNIYFEKIFVTSDTLKNRFNQKNRGVSIYVDCKNIKFEYLSIDDTGGDNSDHFKLTAAALQVHGWSRNPENIVIRELIVRNVARTAVYLTGNNHKINKVIIENFGFGSNKNMFGLEDAQPGTETEFAGFWYSKCQDCKVDSLEISNNWNKPYSLKFGIGNYSSPAIINNLSLKGEAKFAPIEDDLLTNVLVRNEY